MHRLVITALLALLLGAQCDQPPAPAPTPPERPDAGDAGVCELACKRFGELGCEEAKPTPGGASCVEVCTNVEQSGVTTLSPRCVAASTSCEQARACGYGEGP